MPSGVYDPQECNGDHNCLERHPFHVWIASTRLMVSLLREDVESEAEPVISPCGTDRLRNHVVQYPLGRADVNGDIAFDGDPGFEHRHRQDGRQESDGRAR